MVSQWMVVIVKACYFMFVFSLIEYGMKCCLIIFSNVNHVELSSLFLIGNMYSILSDLFDMRL